MEKFKQFLASTLGRIVLTIVMTILLFGIFLLVAHFEIQFMIYIIAAVCTYFGWKALNFITPNIFLIMPIAGWIIYFVIKFIVALAIGVFVAPFQIGKAISQKISESMAA